MACDEVRCDPRQVLNDEWRAAYRARNAAMAAWAASAGARAEFLDFDALAHAPGGPPAGADGNWHYSCFLQVCLPASLRLPLSDPLLHGVRSMVLPCPARTHTL